MPELGQGRDRASGGQLGASRGSVSRPIARILSKRVFDAMQRRQLQLLNLQPLVVRPLSLLLPAVDDTREPPRDDNRHHRRRYLAERPVHSGQPAGFQPQGPALRVSHRVRLCGRQRHLADGAETHQGGFSAVGTRPALSGLERGVACSGPVLRPPQVRSESPLFFAVLSGPRTPWGPAVYKREGLHRVQRLPRSQPPGRAGWRVGRNDD